MGGRSIVLVGGPDSGKTNYLARLWLALRSNAGEVRASETPGDVKYVEGALEHLLQGRFAPRSEKSVEEQGRTFNIAIQRAAGDEPTQLVVPDVSGELWKDAVETSELPAHWMSQLRSAYGALLFIRVGSDQNVEPLDWVNSAKLMKLGLENKDGGKRPTQVMLCELIRFLEHALGADLEGVRPRVAVLVAAWDRLDEITASKGPTAYLKKEYPLFAGKLVHSDGLDIRTFGVSVVGGDFIDAEFTQRFFKADLAASGYVVEEGRVGQVADLTLPIAWVMGEGNGG